VNLLLRWVAAAAAVWAATHFVPGIHVQGGIQALFVVAAIIGLVNAIVRPILKALACGLIVLTLGLFLLVVNAVMLYVASFIAGRLGYVFTIDSFKAAVIGSIVISVVSWVLSLVLTDSKDD
jgi:putative membrane protein